LQEETVPPDTTDVSDLFKADSGVVSSVDTVNGMAVSFIHMTRIYIQKTVSLCDTFS